jgi:deoxynucleoside kinase
MYRNPERFAMPFQNYVTLTMLKQHIQKTVKPIKLMERSMFSARYCFVEKMLANGMLHEGMYHVLQEWYGFIHEHHNVDCDLIVYLRTTPEVAYERIKKRARDEESCVPFEYIKDLHDLHENWLIHGQFYRPAQVLVLDANLDLENIGREYQRSENSILKPIMIENTNQGITASPSKRNDRERF